MSTRDHSIRDEVVGRAGNRCEYCQLPAQLQIGGFEVDHILPRSRGGQTKVANLAWACPHCNAGWSHLTAGANVVRLAPDVAAAFPTEAAVTGMHLILWRICQLSCEYPALQPHLGMISASIYGQRFCSCRKACR